ncbi:MAG: nucleotidyl transferase AbiEii/AbiGii toxin family protein [Pseudomonadota bacterium]
MTNTSPRPSRPIDPAIVAVLRAVHAAAHAQRLNFFIAGALARDIWLDYIYQVPVARLTRDIDVGIQVSSWSEFEGLRERLISDAAFTPDAHRLHRLFMPSSGVPLDIVPFGGVEDSERRIAWPPEGETVMSLWGFAEAFRAAPLLELAPQLSVRVTSLAGLAALKLFSWSERGRETNRDAVDFWLILRNYGEPCHRQRLLLEEDEMLTAEDYDVSRAGARLLGADMGQILGGQGATLLSGLIAAELNDTQSQRLLNVVLKQAAAEDDYTRFREQLLAVVRGLLHKTRAP